MEKIPTAEEQADKMLNNLNSKILDNDPNWINRNPTIEGLIEFAKLHVEAALKEALDSIPCIGSSSDIATYEEVKDAVLNAYPLENIK